MFRIIQVPLDGTASAEHALPLAASLAQRDGATLQIIRVKQPISSGIYLHRPDTKVVNLDRGLVDEASDNLDPAVRKLFKRTGLWANSIQLDGPVPDTIAQNASASGADLLVMTTHGRGPLPRFWFGSVADSLVRQSPIPILFVRSQETVPDFSQLPSVRHVLIPLDGSQFAEQAQEPALALAKGKNSEFTLLRVVPAVMPAAQDRTTEQTSAIRTSWHQQLHELKCDLETEAHEYLERIADRLRSNSLNVQTLVVAHAHPATAILNAASRRAVDAIALTTRGQGGLKRLLLGSVADKVVRGANMPVLISPVAGQVDVGQRGSIEDRSIARGRTVLNSLRPTLSDSCGPGVRGLQKPGGGATSIGHRAGRHRSVFREYKS